MDEGAGAATGDEPGGLDDALGADGGPDEGPLGRLVDQVGLQLVHAGGVLFDVVAVVQTLVDDDVHPGQRQGDVGSRLDGQPVLRLARGRGVAGVHHHQLGAALDRPGQLLDLGVVHVLAQVRPDQRDHPAVLHVRDLGRAHARAVGQLVGHFAGTSALRPARSAVVGRAKGLGQGVEPGTTEAVDEEGHGLGAVLLADLVQALGGLVERVVPAHRAEHLFAPLLSPDQRLLQPVGVVQQAGAPGTARAEVALGEGMRGVADQLGDPALLDVGEQTAFPEAHLAERGDHLVAIGLRVGALAAVHAETLGRQAGAHGRQAQAAAADLDELSAADGHLASQSWATTVATGVPC